MAHKHRESTRWYFTGQTIPFGTLYVDYGLDFFRIAQLEATAYFVGSARTPRAHSKIEGYLSALQNLG